MNEDVINGLNNISSMFNNNNVSNNLKENIDILEDDLVSNKENNELSHDLLDEEVEVLEEVKFPGFTPFKHDNIIDDTVLTPNNEILEEKINNINEINNVDRNNLDNVIVNNENIFSTLETQQINDDNLDFIENEDILLDDEEDIKEDKSLDIFNNLKIEKEPIKQESETPTDSEIVEKNDIKEDEDGDFSFGDETNEEKEVENVETVENEEFKQNIVEKTENVEKTNNDENSNNISLKDEVEQNEANEFINDDTIENNREETKQESVDDVVDEEKNTFDNSNDISNEDQSNEKNEVNQFINVDKNESKNTKTEEFKQESVEKTNIVENFNDSNETLLEKYGENFSIKKYVCNPAIGRDNEIKQLILTLLTPEKSGILVGKPGIGKTAIVEGLGYQIQMGNVPDALRKFQIYKLNTSSLLGNMHGTNEPKIQVLLNEIKNNENLILFIDEIHTLIGAGATGDDSLDFANIFKPGLDRGNIKIIGATTSDEYDRYILTDKAFVRRFQKIEVLEPTKEHTVKILMGSLPKLEYKTGAVMKYTPFIQEKIMTFIVDLTSEYRRVYELSARYPDVSLTILQQAFSYAVFDNKKEVSIRDVKKAIKNTKLVYSDVIKKELVRFNEEFSDIYRMETVQRLKGETVL